MSTNVKKSEKKSTPEKNEKKSEQKKQFEPDYSFVPSWSVKLKISAEEIIKEIEDIAVQLKEKYKDTWSLEKIYSTARRRVYSEHKSEAQSSAVPWKLFPTYCQDPNDYGEKHYKANLDYYSKNQLDAVKKGYVKIEKTTTGKVSKITPLEERQKDANDKDKKSYGKPLPEHAWICTIGGIAIPLHKSGEGKIEARRPFEMTVSGNYADPTSKSYFVTGFEIGKWYEVKASNRTKKDNLESYELNATSVSKWIECNDIEELSIDEIKEIYTDYFASLGELEDYHNNFMKENVDGSYQFCTRYVVTEGDVTDITLSEDETKNTRLLLDDESLGFGDEGSDEIKNSITCWVNKSIPIVFGKFSRVLVFGKTSRGLKKDFETKEVTEEWNNVSIAVDGIIVIDLVEPEVEEETAGEKEENHKAVDDAKIEEPDLEKIVDEEKTPETTEEVITEEPVEEQVTPEEVVAEEPAEEVEEVKEPKKEKKAKKDKW